MTNERTTTLTLSETDLCYLTAALVTMRDLPGMFTDEGKAAIVDLAWRVAQATYDMGRLVSES